MIAVAMVFIIYLLLDDLCEWVVWHFGKDGKQVEESIPKWTSVADGLPKQDGFYEVCVKEQYAETRRFGRKLKVIRIYEYRPCGEGEHLWTG